MKLCLCHALDNLLSKMQTQAVHPKRNTSHRAYYEHRATGFPCFFREPGLTDSGSGSEMRLISLET